MRNPSRGKFFFIISRPRFKLGFLINQIEFSFATETSSLHGFRFLWIICYHLVWYNTSGSRCVHITGFEGYIFIPNTISLRFRMLKLRSILTWTWTLILKISSYDKLFKRFSDTFCETDLRYWDRWRLRIILSWANQIDIINYPRSMLFGMNPLELVPKPVLRLLKLKDVRFPIPF